MSKGRHFSKRSRQFYRGAVLLLFFLTAADIWSQLDQLQIVEPPKSSLPAVESSETPAVSPSEPLAAPASGSDPSARISIRPDEVTVTGNGSAAFELIYEFPDGFHQTKQEDFFGITAPEASPFRVREVVYPESGIMENGVLSYYGSAVLRVVVDLSSDVTPGEYRVPFTAGYQLCDDAGVCYFPSEEIVEVSFQVPEGTAAASGTAPGGGKAGYAAADGAVPGSENVGVAGGDPGGENVGAAALLRFLLFAFIGGLLLNVMPCVLPVLSIRALNLVNQSGNSRREIFTGSLLYTAGVLASLLVLAGAVIALKLSGELVGWGFQFQNPLFVVFLITVIFVFALSLFDVYIFQAPAMNGAVRRAGQKGYIGSFFNGIIAVLLATPCTAPLLGTALGFAFSQPPLMIVGIFTMVGTGFALPFLLIGIWPAAIQRLPKPGEWMNTFKELMGFVLLGTVIYLLSILRFQISPEEMIQVLIFLLVLGFLLWVYGKSAKPTAGRKRKWIILALFIILSVSAAGRLLQFEERGVTTKNESVREGWESFSPEALAEYRQAGKPVLVIFSAEWCTVCKLNEQTVLHTKSAEELFESLDLRVLYGDYTNQDKIIGEWIRAYGRAGVPVYAYYPPGSSSYRLLPEVLSMQILESSLLSPAP
ncbi:MAG: thioredoxin family protein [Sediminispirochaetaceae bacterium]